MVKLLLIGFAGFIGTLGRYWLGRRTQLGTSDIKASEGWHALRVTMTGDHIECYYNGRKYLDVNDSTFKDAGKIGLWTKADAQTRFDDLRVSGN